jgi:hypothetical protein
MKIYLAGPPEALHATHAFLDVANARAMARDGEVATYDVADANRDTLNQLMLEAEGDFEGDLGRARLPSQSRLADIYNELAEKSPAWARRRRREQEEEDAHFLIVADAQKITTVKLTHGGTWWRVRHTKRSQRGSSHCTCGATNGQFHVVGCDKEECPKCHNARHNCRHFLRS